MRNSYSTPARTYSKGMGEAVADRTINRKIDSGGNIGPNGRTETWADVAKRVSEGNVALLPIHAAPGEMRNFEFHAMHHHLRQASLLMSGRHLQHGDITQPTRPMEVFTNCSTSVTSFLTFYLLLNGSGVGRAYDDLMMKVDWRKMPLVVCTIDSMHGDVQSGEINCINKRTAKHFYLDRNQVEFVVPDSREGWAKAVEQIERMAFEGAHRESVLLLDFSDVRKRGSPIGGMQNRPASGPGPIMAAIKNLAMLRDAGMPSWRSAMYADHYLAECVLVGGARRAARMATKNWRDKSVLEFIQVKQGGFLWSSNNSVTVDAKFWRYVNKVEAKIYKAAMGVSEVLSQAFVTELVNKCRISELEAHAWRVFDLVTKCSYHDKTGEPGLINQDKMSFNPDGIAELLDGNFAESSRYKLDTETLELHKALGKTFVKSPYKLITNPCGEIALTMLGGYCVIADVVPYHSVKFFDDAWKDNVDHASSDDDAEDAFRVATRALIRTNLMESLYAKEVRRTNRIGVGMTGIHEYAWARFGYGWKDLVNESASLDFWMTLARFKRAVKGEAESYSALLGVVAPHTDTTMKPAGCATPDTVVRTPEGNRSLADIFALNGYRVIDLQKMADGTWIDSKFPVALMDENDEPREVTRLYVNGVKPVFEIEFEDGHTVKLTDNHKLKTINGWKRVDELTEEDEIVSYETLVVPAGLIL